MIIYCIIHIHVYFTCILRFCPFVVYLRLYLKLPLAVQAHQLSFGCVVPVDDGPFGMMVGLPVDMRSPDHCLALPLPILPLPFLLLPMPFLPLPIFLLPILPLPFLPLPLPPPPLPPPLPSPPLPMPFLPLPIFLLLILPLPFLPLPFLPLPMLF